jgi:queuine tRNA-ribosyltransferase
MLTPERATEVQALLDATIAMALDECTAWPSDEGTAAQSMRRSMRWAARSRAAFTTRGGYGQFGIVQGSVYPALREESAAALKAIGFEGYAIGGLAVGEGQALMLATVEATVPRLPGDRPRYLMGVGKPEDIVAAVARGIDLFDCVIPTRSGRTGQAFTPRGALNLRNARHAEDPRPLVADCRCPACRSLSRAYLHHLVKAGEILGAMLLSWHNLAYYQDLMASLRQALEEDRFAAAAEALARALASGDPAPAG